MSGQRVSDEASRPAPANMPRAARVRSHGGEPVTIDGEPVRAQFEDWLVEGWWWTDKPIRRRYWEVETSTGRTRVVFRDLMTGGWYIQAA